MAVKVTQPPDEEWFRKSLKYSGYTHNLILQAIAIYQNCRQQRPEKNYAHTYFGGILRNLADQQIVEHLNTHLGDVYYHHWESLKKVQETEIYSELNTDPKSTFLTLITDYLEMLIPSYECRILLQIKECFLMHTQGLSEMASSLRKNLSDITLEMKYHDRKKREYLLGKLFEWENLVKTYRLEAISSTT